MRVEVVSRRWTPRSWLGRMQREIRLCPHPHLSITRLSPLCCSDSKTVPALRSPYATSWTPAKADGPGRPTVPRKAKASSALPHPSPTRNNQPHTALLLPASTAVRLHMDRPTRRPHLAAMEAPRSRPSSKGTTDRRPRPNPLTPLSLSLLRPTCRLRCLPGLSRSPRHSRKCRCKRAPRTPGSALLLRHQTLDATRPRGPIPLPHLRPPCLRTRSDTAPLRRDTLLPADEVRPSRTGAWRSRPPSRKMWRWPMALSLPRLEHGPCSA